MVGPCQSGKTMIANFLSDATENVGADYRPTVGARILEFEMPSLNVASQNVKAEVEMWDVSGSNQFEGCWSAIQRDAHGVIFVFNPDSAAQAKQLDAFHQAFVQGRNIPDSACVVFAHFLSSQVRLNNKYLIKHPSIIAILTYFTHCRTGKVPSYLTSFHGFLNSRSTLKMME